MITEKEYPCLLVYYNNNYIKKSGKGMLLKLKINPENFLRDKLKTIVSTDTKGHKALPDLKKHKPRVPSSPQSAIFIEILSILNEIYPKTFPLKGPRPSLKKGIFPEIAEVVQARIDVPKNLLRNFMSWYTKSALYWKYHKGGVPRYNLDYQIVGYVTEEESKSKMAAMEVINARKRNTKS